MLFSQLSGIGARGSQGSRRRLRQTKGRELIKDFLRNDRVEGGDVDYKEETNVGACGFNVLEYEVKNKKDSITHRPDRHIEESALASSDVCEIHKNQFFQNFFHDR